MYKSKQNKQARFTALSSRKMCLEIENFAKNFHKIALPSTLWAIHVDPSLQYIIIAHLIRLDTFNTFTQTTRPPDKVIEVDKSMLITSENGALKVVVSVNDEVVQFPNKPSDHTIIESSTEILHLLNSLENIRLCRNVNNVDCEAKCLKYILNEGNEVELCECCSLEEICNTDPLGDSAAIVHRDEDEKSPEIPINPPEARRTAKKTNRSLCSICGRIFQSPSLLSSHMFSHSGEKPFECTVCMKTFTRKTYLANHCRVHSGDRVICSVCGRSYTTLSNLTTHMRNTHGDKKCRCHFCGKAFVYPRHLRIHLRKHTGEKPFKCDTCGRPFAKKVHLTVHTRTHTGERPFLCSDCGRGFTTTGNLKTHRQSKHLIKS